MRADGWRVDRVAVAPEPLVPVSYDYADAFELRLDQPDVHTPEEWVRAGLEQSGEAVRGLIRFVHARIARFELREDGILGWETVSSTAEAVHLRTEGPLLRAEIVARRTAQTSVSVSVSTFLYYKSGVAPVLWLAIGPVHRRVAPLLLHRAASVLAVGGLAATGPTSIPASARGSNSTGAFDGYAVAEVFEWATPDDGVDPGEA